MSDSNHLEQAKQHLLYAIDDLAELYGHGGIHNPIRQLIWAVDEIIRHLEEQQ